MAMLPGTPSPSPTVSIDVNETLHRVERIHATGYMAVAAATLIFYDYVLTLKHEGELSFYFLLSTLYSVFLLYILYSMLFAL